MPAQQPDALQRETEMPCEQLAHALVGQIALGGLPDLHPKPALGEDLYLFLPGPGLHPDAYIHGYTIHHSAPLPPLAADARPHSGRAVSFLVW